MLRGVGSALVLLGCVLLALDETRWDRQFLAFPGAGSHGIRASEALGFTLAVAGVAALWVGGTRR
jgi:hypothetical protein